MCPAGDHEDRDVPVPDDYHTAPAMRVHTRGDDHRPVLKHVNGQDSRQYCGSVLNQAANLDGRDVARLRVGLREGDADVDQR